MTDYYKSKQLWQLTIAHFKEVIREPGVLFWGIVFPILMSLGLGIAFTRNADSVRKIALIDTQLSSIIDSTYISSNSVSDTVDKSGVTFSSLLLKNEKLGNS